MIIVLRFVIKSTRCVSDPREIVQITLPHVNIMSVIDDVGFLILVVIDILRVLL